MKDQEWCSDKPNHNNLCSIYFQVSINSARPCLLSIFETILKLIILVGLKAIDLRCSRYTILSYSFINKKSINHSSILKWYFLFLFFPCYLEILRNIFSFYTISFPSKYNLQKIIINSFACQRISQKLVGSGTILLTSPMNLKTLLFISKPFLSF